MVAMKKKRIIEKQKKTDTEARNMSLTCSSLTQNFPAHLTIKMNSHAFSPKVKPGTHVLN